MPSLDCRVGTVAHPPQKELHGDQWADMGAIRRPLKDAVLSCEQSLLPVLPQLILVQLYPTAVRSCIPRKMADNVYTGFWIDWGKFRPPDSVR